MIEYLDTLDKSIFLFLNGLHSPFCDQLMYYISEKWTWIPFYLLLLWMIIIKFKKQTYLILPFIILLIVLSDQTSVHLFKNVFERLRPCHEPGLSNLVHIVNGRCGGSFGFVSSHATNTFALAVFVGLILRNHYKYIIALMLLYAIIVSYSRIYLGVHYPGDVLGGALLGSLIGWLVFRAYHYSLIFQKKP